ncbi:sigma-54 dependent transcriptional regulator [Blastopirellula sp. JC732]|uniref:Sigma-54 dependent transcriptional regulator n=1 Tax=Blastopirellula sediminis TaxID=2894196 RepID=A0A9X1MQW3_9BACT|nr:sigma-54 dependent transcriptional regulator [Blastopirellula sediminis]MCC9605634.1 sigma-54 dependent transcriptional regulator [Blastopirellula sediminis]MCC9631066.1 sigma-54 dependent transcriptional regulator [Blastopirellula sediminis]
MKILFADDEKSLQKLMSLELPRLGHEVTVCPDGLTAVAALERNTYDCILVDLDMPGLNGIQVIGKAKELSPETEAIVLTGKSSTESAISALRFGAFDYLTKPCRLVELQALLDRVADKRELTRKYRAVKSRLEKLEGKSNLIGDSPSMQQVGRLIAKVAPSNSTVLIRGETGTGKELVARALHDQSHRVEMPFVAVNCGALPENLIESELFGHRKGSFTGAEDTRIGLFEVANGGTLFLDEIGELPKSLQAKLLRVLETGEIRRVGDNDSMKVDVRIVCATHRDVEQMVAEGDFREDLMFRINTFEIHLPPLRERTEDIPLLAEHLCRRFWPNVPMTQTVFSSDAIRALKSHDWPGNVRELANVVEHATILCEEPPIEPDHLPRRFGRTGGDAMIGSSGPAPGKPVLKAIGPLSLRELEMQAIYEALERHEGNKPQAAEELGVSLKTLYNKLNQASTMEKSA